MSLEHEFGVTSPLLVDELDIESLPVGTISKLRLRMVEDGTGRPVRIPVMVARGTRPGRVVGITAAVHGNELNGIPIIHRLFHDLDTSELSGAVVAVPVVNVFGYLDNQRYFHDGTDLNRVFPGKPHGNSAQVYAYRFVNRVVRHFDVLIDLHTASFGRVNSLYIRADLTAPMNHTLSRLISPQIVVHNPGRDGTLRSAASELGIPAITVEVGDPNRLQKRLIKACRYGIQAVLEHLDVLPDDDDDEELASTAPLIQCYRSYWLYTDVGGVLEVFPRTTDYVRKGERVARVTNVFGDLANEYEAPNDGVVIGKSTNPVAHTGARILHLGLLGAPDTD